MVIAAEHWGGGYYELDVALEGELSVDTLEALWSHPALDGPFVDDASAKMRRATWDELRTAHAQDLEHLPDCYGIATLHDGARVPCRSFCLTRYVGAGDEPFPVRRAGGCPLVAGAVGRVVTPWRVKLRSWRRRRKRRQ